MIAYVIRRFLWTILLLLVVTLVTFLIFYVLPTAAPAALRGGANPSQPLTEAIRHQLGLDQPILEQYYHYVKNLVVHFSFGHSYINNQDVKKLIFARLKNAIFLVVGAAVIWFTAGCLIGIVSAVFRGRIWDRLLMGGALIAISATVYWLGVIGLFLFSDDNLMVEY